MPGIRDRDAPESVIVMAGIANPAAFDGAWSRAARAEHVLGRMAFVHALFEWAGVAQVTLHRGVAGTVDPARGPASFVSRTFDRAVAESMLGPRGGASGGVVETRVFAPARLFMKFLETSHLNAQYREREAVLVSA
jgi:hypothetical protein